MVYIIRNNDLGLVLWYSRLTQGLLPISVSFILEHACHLTWEVNLQFFGVNLMHASTPYDQYIGNIWVNPQEILLIFFVSILAKPCTLSWAMIESSLSWVLLFKWARLKEQDSTQGRFIAHDKVHGLASNASIGSNYFRTQENQYQ